MISKASFEVIQDHYLAHNLVNDYVLRYNTLNESLKWNLRGLLVEQIMSIMLLTCQGLIFFLFLSYCITIALGEL